MRAGPWGRSGALPGPVQPVPEGSEFSRKSWDPAGARAPWPRQGSHGGPRLGFLSRPSPESAVAPEPEPSPSPPGLSSRPYTKWEPHSQGS